jgi:pimeloyl-ACP methyl ester carboxylesterase
VVIAANDRVMDKRRSRALAAALGAEVVVHPSAGHGLVVEDPEWLAAACLRFLDEVSAGP